MMLSSGSFPRRDEHGLDDAVVLADCLVVACLLVLLSDARVVGPELVLGVRRAEENAQKATQLSIYQENYKNVRKSQKRTKTRKITKTYENHKNVHIPSSTHNTWSYHV